MRDNIGSRLLRRVVDPTRIEYGVASSVVVGALSLVDPARLSAGQRFAFRGVTALVTGGLVLIELRRNATFEGNPAARFGIVTGAVGTVFGLSEFSERIDARLISALARGGVRRPRVALAAASALSSLATFRVGATPQLRSPDDAGEWPRIIDIERDLRDLVNGMLSATDGHGATELRVHWASARVELWSEEDGSGEFSRWLEFAVDESLPRAIPHDTTFPVRARFLSPAGVPVEAFLLVSGGRLRSLLIDVVPGTPELEQFDGGDPLDDLAGWPRRDQVTFVLDTA